MVTLAETDAEIMACHAVMAELRPHVARTEFLPRVRAMQAEGYRLACLREHGTVVAVAGYRIASSFWLGRHLFVDDLVTAAAARSSGHGATLLHWLQQTARDAGCAFIDLESGTQRGRAHRFYFAQGFTIDAYHFCRRLDDD